MPISTPTEKNLSRLADSTVSLSLSLSPYAHQAKPLPVSPVRHDFTIHMPVEIRPTILFSLLCSSHDCSSKPSTFSSSSNISFPTRSRKFSSSHLPVDSDPLLQACSASSYATFLLFFLLLKHATTEISLPYFPIFGSKAFGLIMRSQTLYFTNKIFF